MKQPRTTRVAALAVSALCAVLLPIHAQAATATFSALKVAQISVFNSAAGGSCAVRFAAVDFSTQSLNCTNTNTVTLDCPGKISNKQIALRKLESAQLAFALNANVSVTVTDGNKADGFCYATQLNISK